MRYIKNKKGEWKQLKSRPHHGSGRRQGHKKVKE